MSAKAWVPALASSLLCVAALVTPAAGQQSSRAQPDASAAVTQAGVAQASVILAAAEIELALELSPLPDVPADPTNAVADDRAAARLGQALFFDERLSGPGSVSCATCHDPALGFGDGRKLARAVAHHPRHTPSLWNVGHNRWFFWDGRKDTLWSQALAPFEDPREHASSRLQVVHAVADDPALARAYSHVFGALPDLSDRGRFPPEGRPVPGEDEHAQALAWASMDAADQLAVNRVFTNLGKAIAAYERRIVSRQAPFDLFVEGLRDGDEHKLAALSPSAQRGFSLFVGEARCILCHDGPSFTDKEFHSNRVPTGEGTDPGRGLGILRLQEDPFNSASQWADDGGKSAVGKLSFPQVGWELPGSFKTPGLRNVAFTAPYMHEGQLATLEEVLDFYNTLERAAPPGKHDERILRPLNLGDDLLADLLAFLHALSDDSLPAELRSAPDSPELP